MSQNPVTWLACRERWQAASFWVIAGLLIACFVPTALINPTLASSQFWQAVAGILTLVLYLGFASHACRFFVDARKNALLEVLLSTPLDTRYMVEGQWRAVLRMFGAPAALFVSVYFIGNFINHQNSANANLFASFGTAAAEVLVIPFDLAALIWFGMWMGMISRNANAAVWKTIFFALLLPTFVVVILTGAFMLLLSNPRFAPPGAWIEFVGAAIPAIASLAIDWALYASARRRLLSELRPRVAAVLIGRVDSQTPVEKL